MSKQTLPAFSPYLPKLGLGGSLLVSIVLMSGCAAREVEPAPPSPPLVDEAEPTEGVIAATEIVKLQEELNARDEEITRLSGEITRLSGEVTRLSGEVTRLHGELHVLNDARVALEEENVSLELELGITLEELLRIQANLRNVQSRALAVSRISEVRVELETFRTRRDPALTDRLDRADNFLARADDAFAQGNVGGAAFLAERAGELVRQCKTIAEVRRGESDEMFPIVPQREIEVRAAANLRRRPQTGAELVGTVPAGSRLKAVGRLGDWFQVRTASGETVWIHGSLVK